MALSFLAPLLHPGEESWVLTHQRTGSALAVSIELAIDGPRRRRGLLGRARLAPGAAMILAPCGGVHTFFMQFPIDVLFVRRDGIVVKICNSMGPWRIALALRAFAAIELPATTAGGAGVECGDVLTIEPAAPRS